MAAAWIATMLQRAVSGSRSSVLAPLLSLDGVLAATFIACVFFHAETWVLVSVAIAGGVSLLVTLLMYVYFAVKSPEQLRSETYALQHIALEKGMVGDHLHAPQLEAPAPEELAPVVQPIAIEAAPKPKKLKGGAQRGD